MNFLRGQLLGESPGEWVFESPYVKCGLAAKSPLPGSGAAGREVELGVRPEDVVLSSAEVPGLAAGEVKFVESLGDATIVHVELRPNGGGKGTGEESGAVVLTPVVLAKVEPRASWQRGDLTSLRFRGERLHVFDLATGEALQRG